MTILCVLGSVFLLLAHFSSARAFEYNEDPQSNAAFVPCIQTALCMPSQGLRDVPRNFCDVTQLVSIDLSGNHLKNLPEVFDRISALRFLNLSDNALKTIPRFVAQLRHIEHIDLSKNALRGSAADIFYAMPRLKTLDLSHNGLEGPLPLSLIQCQNLERLHLSHNQFKDDVTGFFGHFFSLTHLSLNDNPSLTGRLGLTSYQGLGEKYLRACFIDRTGIEEVVFQGRCPWAEPVVFTNDKASLRSIHSDVPLQEQSKTSSSVTLDQRVFQHQKAFENIYMWKGSVQFSAPQVHAPFSAYLSSLGITPTSKIIYAHHDGRLQLSFCAIGKCTQGSRLKAFFKQSNLLDAYPLLQTLTEAYNQHLERDVPSLTYRPQKSSRSVWCEIDAMTRQS